MIWPLKNTTAQLDHSALALDPFISLALKGQEKAIESKNKAKTGQLIECYIYGAIRYIASYDDLNTENSKVLLHKMLSAHFDENDDEVNKSIKRLSEPQKGKTEQLFMIEGASALRRYLVNGDRTVTTNLIELLELHKTH